MPLTALLSFSPDRYGEEALLWRLVLIARDKACMSKLEGGLVIKDLAT
jgi:hypothetical protein